MAGDGAEGEGGTRPGVRELLRGALVDDEDPRFPWWLPLPGLVVALAWAGYEGVVGGSAAEFARTLLWPGAGLFALATAATFFGWQLDID